jgi:hypothetical protein
MTSKSYLQGLKFLITNQPDADPEALLIFHLRPQCRHRNLLGGKALKTSGQPVINDLMHQMNDFPLLLIKMSD